MYQCSDVQELKAKSGTKEENQQRAHNNKQVIIYNLIQRIGNYNRTYTYIKTKRKIKKRMKINKKNTHSYDFVIYKT